MFSVLFKRKPPLDELSILWLFDVYGWALRNFSATYFNKHTLLVLPSNDHFPGRVNSTQGMAELVFARVAEYAGMSHWRWQVLDSSHCSIHQDAILPEDAGRAAPGASSTVTSPPLPVVYDARLIGNPEALIAGFAHTLAYYLGRATQEPPPGGSANWPQVTEVLAVFLGFGLMFANSAFSFHPAGCGSCGTGNSGRQNYLSQWDVTYALAIFTVLKGISRREVKSHLKKSLRSHFNRCVADVKAREALLATLQEADKLREPIAVHG